MEMTAVNDQSSLIIIKREESKVARKSVSRESKKELMKCKVAKKPINKSKALKKSDRTKKGKSRTDKVRDREVIFKKMRDSSIITHNAELTPIKTDQEHQDQSIPSNFSNLPVKTEPRDYFDLESLQEISEISTPLYEKPVLSQRRIMQNKVAGIEDLLERALHQHNSNSKKTTRSKSVKASPKNSGKTKHLLSPNDADPKNLLETKLEEVVCTVEKPHTSDNKINRQRDSLASIDSVCKVFEEPKHRSISVEMTAKKRNKKLAQKVNQITQIELARCKEEAKEKEKRP